MARRKRRGNAAAAGTAGEDAFQLGEAARDDETLFIVHLNDVVENLHVHGGRKKILADAFDDVGSGLDGFAGLEEIVVERAEGIDADDFDGGIFFFQIFSDAADGAAGAHAADEMRDLALAVFPNFRAGGEVMRFGIHGIVILVRIKGIGNFARQFFRDGIVAARIVGLDSGGTDDDFGAESFEEIDFFLGLLIRGGENHL